MPSLVYDFKDIASRMKGEVEARSLTKDHDSSTCAFIRLMVGDPTICVSCNGSGMDPMHGGRLAVLSRLRSKPHDRGLLAHSAAPTHACLMWAMSATSMPTPSVNGPYVAAFPRSSGGQPKPWHHMGAVHTGAKRPALQPDGAAPLEGSNPQRASPRTTASSNGSAGRKGVIA